MRIPLQKEPPARRQFLKGVTSLGLLAMLSCFLPSCSPGDKPALAGAQLGEGGELPEPRKDGDVSVEEALQTRRSIRTYSGEALTLGEVSQLLWSAQGITDSKGFRTAPSAAATYTLETYLIAGDVDDLVEGVYRYKPVGHKLVKVLDGDYRTQLTRTTAGRYFVEGGAIYLLFTGVYSRIGLSDEGKKYVHM